jgi:hypothetical protein
LARLIYLALGQTSYLGQAIFSILSARRYCTQGLSVPKITLYTDLPIDSEGLVDDLVTLSEDEVYRWTAGGRYVFRAKILALDDALHRYGEATALLDTDTFFKASPSELFERIGPGRALMERVEPIRLAEPTRLLAEKVRLDPRVRTYLLAANSPMWNAGVIGMDPSNAGLVAEVLALSDALFDSIGDWYVEQYAFTAALGRSLQLREASDIVYHYCHPVLKRAFERSFRRFNARWGSMPLGERATACMDYRPRWDYYNTAKILAKQALRQAGLFRKPIRFDLT